MSARDLNISPRAEMEPEEAAAMGLLPGSLAEGVYDARWDPQDDFCEAKDMGWIGEDARGIWMRRHPSTALTEHPKLWAVVDRFRYGGAEITAQEYDTSSAYEMEARIVMAMAHSRDIRRSRSRPEDDD